MSDFVLFSDLIDDEFGVTYASRCLTPISSASYIPINRDCISPHCWHITQLMRTHRELRSYVGIQAPPLLLLWCFLLDSFLTRCQRIVVIFVLQGMRGSNKLWWFPPGDHHKVWRILSLDDHRRNLPWLVLWQPFVAWIASPIVRAN